ncbi:translocation/assembly module TamB domain-containing protein [Hydrogenimonas urashimensis]|uniref:translocation/assembly module TamB domain-containing protein n=1 Tax=Hydrogenimonas urashimensis TaxID=2740515 RepID=UPI00191527BF|nr:translocation/assembly module TamB domain-containing protein [Hydrogenimonas urashimensis]
MRRLYAKLALSLQGAIILTGLFFYVTLHPETTNYIAKKALRDNGILYKKIEGTLYTGFDVYDIAYKKAFHARHASLHYSIFRLLSPAPAVDSVLLEDVKIYPGRFDFKTKKGKKTSSIVLPPLRINRIAIDNCDIFLPDRIGFDLDARNFRWFGRDFDIPSFSIAVRSPYARGRFEGMLHNLDVTLKGRASFSRKYHLMAAKVLRKVPENLPIAIHINQNRLKASTHLATPLCLREHNLSIGRLHLDFNYFFEENYMTSKATYRLRTTAVDADINQTLLMTPSLAYASRVKGVVVRQTHPLPAKRFEADAAGDESVVTADFYMGAFNISLFSTDYDLFALKATAKPHKIEYLEHLPKLFSQQTISLEANATAKISPDPSLKGVIRLDGNYSTSKSFVEIHPESVLVRASVEPKDVRGGIWESVPPMFKSEVNAYIFYSKNNKLFNISAPKAYITLFERDKVVKGWANVGSLTLDVKGGIEKDDSVNLDFHTHIDSLYALMQDFNIKSEVTVDAEVDSRFSLRISDWITLRYHTQIPWYLVQPDSQTVYYGLDSRLVGGVNGEKISIDSYDIGFKERRFTQKRPSYFHFDQNLTFHVDRFCVLDTGELKGSLNLNEMTGDFRFEGEAMRYVGREGNITADAGIDVNLTQKSLDVEGEVKVTDANITYMPKKEYTVTDEDIIIIQDIREPSHTRKSLNVRIYSTTPLRYDIPMIHLRFKPDVTIWKEPLKPTVLLGIVRLVDGALDVEEKHFRILPSEIYFGGAYPINPYLDLHIRYEIDFNRFNIYVSHTLADPVFLFSSEPPMSQNDIMSYILFGSPADESFQGRGDASTSVATMLLGMGLKSAIGSATGLKFDTFNILNTEEGGFGIEIGKRIGKRFRIIYRNDTLSSFIIQYKISRSIRVDVDVKETGQGINVLYIKDFRDLGLFDKSSGDESR